MAHPIGVKSDFKTKSVENGASNRSKGVFRFYSHLKLALSLSQEQTLRHINSKIVERQTLHAYDLMNTVSLKDFLYFVTLPRDRDRQLQEFEILNTPSFLLVAPFSTDFAFKPDFTPIGCAIFN